MKLYIIILLTIFISLNEVIYSQELKENSKDSDTGLVNFLRGKGFSGSTSSFSALIDKKRVCKLNKPDYFSCRPKGLQGFANIKKVSHLLSRSSKAADH